MTNHAENAKRYHERITALHNIATHTDQNLSPERLARWQRAESERWKAATAQITPSVQPVPEHSTVLDSLKPRTADDVALHAREREKVTARVTASHTLDSTLDSIIATADRTRLAAILDAVETSDDVLASSEGDAIVAERTAAIFDRLAEIDDDARKVADAEAAAAPGAAWATIFADAAEQGVAGISGKTALYRADSSAYDLVVTAEREVDAAAIDRMLHVLAYSSTHRRASSCWSSATTPRRSEQPGAGAARLSTLMMRTKLDRSRSSGSGDLRLELNTRVTSSGEITMGKGNSAGGKKPVSGARLHQKSGAANAFGGYKKVDHGNGTFSMKRTKGK